MRYHTNMSEYKITGKVVVVIDNEFGLEEAKIIEENYIVPKNRIDRVEINNLINIDLNGIQALHSIRKTFPNIEIIISEEDINSSILLNSGLADFFQFKNSLN